VRNRNEFDEFGICFFITFIFSCIIIAKYLYSQVILLCAKRRPKTVIHIVITKKGNQEQTMLKIH